MTMTPEVRSFMPVTPDRDRDNDLIKENVVRDVRMTFPLASIVANKLRVEFTDEVTIFVCPIKSGCKFAVSC